MFRDNVFHDSWNNDILKINNGARFVTVEGNVFYNQTGSDEHMDVNSVTDVVIQDNIFFNDFAGSGRVNGNDTSSFIVMKDCNAGDDGQIGAERITVRRNVFLNWEGCSGSNFVLVGEDGMPYFEGEDILVENNLMIGNSANDMRAAFGVKGGRNVTFRNNTVVGNLPSLAYAFRINQEGANPVNENVALPQQHLVRSDRDHGRGGGGGTNEFSDGAPAEATGLVLDHNLYWNGGAAIPPGDLVSPLVDDARRIVADPAARHEPGGHRPAALERAPRSSAAARRSARSSSGSSASTAPSPRRQPGGRSGRPRARARRRHPAAGRAERRPTSAPTRPGPRGHGDPDLGPRRGRRAAHPLGSGLRRRRDRDRRRRARRATSVWERRRSRWPPCPRWRRGR